jgi:hypothetical protein
MGEVRNDGPKLNPTPTSETSQTENPQTKGVKNKMGEVVNTAGKDSQLIGSSNGRELDGRVSALENIRAVGSLILSTISTTASRIFKLSSNSNKTDLSTSSEITEASTTSKSSSEFSNKKLEKLVDNIISAANRVDTLMEEFKEMGITEHDSLELMNLVGDFESMGNVLGDFTENNTELTPESEAQLLSTLQPRYDNFIESEKIASEQLEILKKRSAG